MGYEMFKSTLLLLFLVSSVHMQGEEGEPAVDEGEAEIPLDELLDRTLTVSTSQCNAEDQCQCKVESPQPCAYDVEYAELVRARAQLDSVYAHVKGEVVEGLRVDLAVLVVRMSALEASLHNQSISLSMSELAGLQDQVSTIQTTLSQLSLSVNSTVTQQLTAEVQAIQASLLQLGTKNPIAVRADVEKELSALRARVASCSTITNVHQEGALDFLGDGLPFNSTITTDHCPAANGNITIGTPVTYKFRNIQAMWLKDPLPVSDEAKTKIYETRSYAAVNQYLFSFENLDDYERTDFLTKQTQSTCSFHIYGQKPLFINGVFYWSDNYSSNRFIKRYSGIFAKSCPLLTSPDRYPNIGFDYNGHIYNDVDLNFDETGLYAVYADSNGDMDIARLDRDTLEREQVWKTGKQKRAVANVFMVCGRLYTIDDYKSRHLSGHQWGYDTNTGEEFTFDMDVESKFGSIQALSYNPREKALFGWDNGHAVLYPVFF